MSEGLPNGWGWWVVGGLENAPGETYDHWG